MKLNITVLNAPWPEGARVGDIIELPAVPLWAVGKCEQVSDDVEPTVFAPEPSDVITGDGTGAALPLIDHREVAESINSLRVESQGRILAAEQQRDDAEAERLAAQLAGDEAKAQLASLQEQHGALVAEFDSQREKLTLADGQVQDLTAKLAEAQLALEQASAPAGATTKAKK